MSYQANQVSSTSTPPARKLRIVSEKGGALLHPATVSEQDLPQSSELIVALKLNGEADEYLEQGVTKSSS